MRCDVGMIFHSDIPSFASPASFSCGDQVFPAPAVYRYTVCAIASSAEITSRCNCRMEGASKIGTEDSSGDTDDGNCSESENRGSKRNETIRYDTKREITPHVPLGVVQPPLSCVCKPASPHPMLPLISASCFHFTTLGHQEIKEAVLREWLAVPKPQYTNTDIVQKDYEFSAAVLLQPACVITIGYTSTRWLYLLPLFMSYAPRYCSLKRCPLFSFWR